MKAMTYMEIQKIHDDLIWILGPLTTAICKRDSAPDCRKIMPNSKGEGYCDVCRVKEAYYRIKELT